MPANTERRSFPRYVTRHGQTLHNPSIQGICFQVAWATMYAKKGAPLNKSNPWWPQYFAYSEWFRLRICAQLKLPLNTKWMVLYRKTGTLNEEEYASEKEWRKAYDLGHSQPLRDEMAPAMFNKFEEIKYHITGRA